MTTSGLTDALTTLMRHSSADHRPAVFLADQLGSVRTAIKGVMKRMNGPKLYYVALRTDTNLLLLASFSSETRFRVASEGNFRACLEQIRAALPPGLSAGRVSVLDSIGLMPAAAQDALCASMEPANLPRCHVYLTVEMPKRKKDPAAADGRKQQQQKKKKQKVAETDSE